MNKVKWSYKPYNKEQAEYLTKKYNIPYVIAVLMVQRGLTEDGEIRSFFNPGDGKPHSPFLLNDMEKAVKRIKEAIKNGEKITVYGDYDVDGVTATAVLYMFLKSVGASAEVFIPHREKDGYGLNTKSVGEIIDGGTSLIITVDCGITSGEEITFAKSKGADVIVTDHHTYKEPLSDAFALVSASVPENTYPNANLAGVGVAFKLVCALAGENRLSEMLDLYCPYVALGTVGDLVPLCGENRILVHRGVMGIKNNVSIGISALINASGAAEREIDSDFIAYTLCPRINAAGRMDNANLAFRLLTCTDYKEAQDLAAGLCNLNDVRRQTESSVSEEIEKYVEENPQFKDKKIIVAAGEGWHHGVLGIVASRITDKYKKPSVILSKSDALSGSCRSVEGFNLFDALKACEGLLDKFGGHSMAAGVTLKEEHLAAFDEKINEYAEKNLPAELLCKNLTVDCEINPAYIKPGLIKMLSRFKPFGSENESPVFSVSGGRAFGISKMGAKKNHLRVTIIKNGIYLNCVGFGMGDYADNIYEGSVVKIAFSPSLNSYMGKTSVQLVLEDLQEDI